jgi:hypothetical protein
MGISVTMEVGVFCGQSPQNTPTSYHVKSQ